MAKSLIVKTEFKAVDGLTKVVRGMTAGVKNFGRSAVTTFARVDRAARRLGQSFKKATGMLGQLGIAMGAAAVGMMLLSANVDLEKNLASLSAITGVTGKDFEAFQTQIDAVSKSQKKFAGDVAKAFEIVGSAKPELLADAEALAKVTEASIILSKATGADLAVSAENLTGTLNQFNLTADESARVMNTLAAGSQAGSAPVSDITESMKKFGAVANSTGVSLEESVGLIETLAEKTIKGAEAGTSLRNVLLKMATIKVLPKNALNQLNRFGVDLDLVSDKTVPVSKRLAELSKIAGDATAVSQVFGSENVIAGQVLLNNTAKVEDYTKAVTGTNTAVDQAAINTNTLSGKWDELTASFKNSVTSTNSNNEGLKILKSVLGFLADNMGTIIPVVMGLTAAFAAFKVVMLVVNAVMYASPITWIVAAILILIGVIALLIIYWEDIVNWVKTSDSGFAKFIRFSLGPFIELFQTLGMVFDWLSEKWGQLVEWIATSDSGLANFIRGSVTAITEAFEYLGVLMDSIFGDSAVTDIEAGIKAKLEAAGITTGAPEAESNKAISNQINKTTTNNSKVDINVNDSKGLTEVTKVQGANVNLSKTIGWQ